MTSRTRDKRVYDTLLAPPPDVFQALEHISLSHMKAAKHLHNKKQLNIKPQNVKGSKSTKKQAEHVPTTE